MRRFLYFIPFLLVFSSCGEYNKVLKSKDVDYRFDFAKRAFDQRKFTQASTVLETIYTPLRGTPNGEEALFLLAMSYYENKDYLNSGVYFKTYYSRYPRGKFAELARFYSGYGYYLDSPDPQLDQSQTVKAIEELQGFLDYFPNSDRVSIAQNAIFEMQDKLTLKELQNAQLYYNLGNYMGNNYESAIITAQNALKNYPYSNQERGGVLFLHVFSGNLEDVVSFLSVFGVGIIVGVGVIFIYNIAISFGLFLLNAQTGFLIF